MIPSFLRLLTPLMLLSVALPATAQRTLPKAFHAGPVIPKFGPVATISDPDMVIPKDTVFQISFDVAKGAEAGRHNRTLESAARFINMHGEAGVPIDNIKLAVVVHGSAVFDMSGDPTYAAKHADGRDGKTPNPNGALIDALRAKGVRIIVCGQSAAAYNVQKADLYPGVEMALSAMTAHGLLQQQGYTLNPF